MTLVLRKPDIEMKKEIIDFNEEWEKAGEKLVPYAARLRGMDFRDWLSSERLMETNAPIGFVKASLYFLMDGERILGAIDIRHSLNEYLLGVGGHIGYGVRPSERRKGYATTMLKLALPLAKELGLKKILITCNKGNTASKKTIVNNGGILENEIEDGDEIVMRFWISED
ncbi:MAG: GNAT family N-acetyltransferase [Clostridiaceae bacterium]